MKEQKTLLIINGSLGPDSSHLEINITLTESEESVGEISLMHYKDMFDLDPPCAGSEKVHEVLPQFIDDLESDEDNIIFIPSSLVYISDVKIHKTHRGNKYALDALEQIIEYYSDGLTLFSIFPWHLSQDGVPVKVLNDYYGKVGFEKYKSTGVMFLVR